MYSQSVTTGPGSLRIGEFARRVGVTPELLRAWERRYGLLRPVRSDGGFRLYTDEDAERVARMRRALDDGLSAAEAARAALERGQPSEGLLEDAAARLLAAIERYDEAAVHAVLDESLARFSEASGASSDTSRRRSVQQAWSSSYLTIPMARCSSRCHERASPSTSSSSSSAGTVSSRAT